MARTRTSLLILVAAAFLGAAFWRCAPDRTAPPVTANSAAVSSRDTGERAQAGLSGDEDIVPQSRRALSTNAPDQTKSPLAGEADRSRVAPSQPLGTDAAGQSATPDHEAPSWKTLPKLSPRWVDSFMRICATPVGNCEADRVVAVGIVNEPEDVDDSWPYRLEYELKQYFEEIAVPNAFESIDVRCTRRGCLAYLTGNQRTMFGSGTTNWEPFWKHLHAQPWIGEFQYTTSGIDGPWGRSRAAGYWSNDREWGLLLVFSRRGGPE